MSALCHKPTLAGHLFNHLVGAGEHRGGNFEAERFGGLQIEMQAYLNI
jgi:hypothetical protein